MSGSTTRLGLKTYDPSDPFLRADFNDTAGKLDAYPGAFICTSATRPSWGAGQAGMRIYETDTRREVVWTGTSWREVLQVPPVWSGWLRPNVTMNAGTNVFYTMATFTVNRPGTLLVLLNAEARCQTTFTMNITVKAQVDGNDCQLDQGSFNRYAQTTTSGGGWARTAIIPTLGLRPVGVGSHNFGLHASVTDTSGTPGGNIILTSMHGVALLVNSQDT